MEFNEFKKIKKIIEIEAGCEGEGEGTYQNHKIIVLAILLCIEVCHRYSYTFKIKHKITTHFSLYK